MSHFRDTGLTKTYLAQYLMILSMQTRPHQPPDRLNQFLCALAVVLTVLACHPFVETPFNDDWSYSHITLNFARTGQIAYDGWCSPTLLLQIYWGSLLIRLFGFSFELLRFSTLPVAMGCGVLCYRLGRIAGLEPRAALFGSLAWVTSPLFVPLSASFMTDIYGAFFTLLTIYCAASAARLSLGTVRRVAWMIAAVLAGAAGGLERQTVYIAPAAALLWGLWRWRRERLLVTAVICLGALFGAFAILALRWQAHQPLGAGELADEITSWRKSAIYPVQFILTLTLYVLPAAIRLGTGRLRIPVRYYAFSLAGVLAGFAMLWRVGHQVLFPWLLNLITQFGILQSGEEMSGRRPAILGWGVRAAITMAVLATLVWMGAMLLNSLVPVVSDRSGARLWKGFCAWPAVLQVSAIYTTVYFTLLVFQARLVVFDRYLLPLIPLALILMLYIAQEALGARPAVVNWVLLAIFGIYGVANTHDYLAALEARLTAFQEVRALGVPRSRISGGLELDGWTETELAGRVSPAPPKASFDDYGYWFLAFAPRIQPAYFLAWSEKPGLHQAPLSAVSFGTWLPPFRREVKILMPDSTAP